ncbi:hypothetical protein GW17_00012975 [Ensete ventricosum]|nr:hypothetical protein GW17_00012975 [Ensete ventricosum]
MICDLSSINEVQGFVSRFSAQEKPLHVLVSMISKRKLRTNNEGADTVIWLALQPKEKLKSGAFYFDRAEAPKHLLFAGTARSHAAIDAIVDSLRSLCKLL